MALSSQHGNQPGQSPKVSLADAKAKAESLLATADAGGDVDALAAPQPGQGHVPPVGDPAAQPPPANAAPTPEPVTPRQPRPLSSQAAQDMMATHEQPPPLAPVDPTPPASQAPIPASIATAPPAAAAAALAPPDPNAPPDPWAETEDVTYEADGGHQYVVRVPKGQAQAVRDGYARRAIMDRSARYLGQARPVLEPLIQSGQFGAVQPFIELALQDPEYQKFLSESYARRVTGRPLSFGDAAAQAAPGFAAAPAAAPQAAPEVYSDDAVMQSIGELVDRVVTGRLDSRLSPFEQAMQRQDAAVVQQQQNEQARQMAQHQAQQVAAQSVSELRSLYPNDFTGTPADYNRVGQLWQYAQEAGLIQAGTPPNVIPSMLRLAYHEASQANARAVVASPAAYAQSAAEVENRARAEAAARVAGASGGGGIIATPPPQSAAEQFRAIPIRSKDGKKPRAIGAVAADVERTLRSLQTG